MAGIWGWDCRKVGGGEQEVLVIGDVRPTFLGTRFQGYQHSITLRELSVVYTVIMIAEHVLISFRNS